MKARIMRVDLAHYCRLDAERRRFAERQNRQASFGASDPVCRREQITNILLPRYAVHGIMFNNGEMAPRRPGRSPR
jgi:hypothetical protein